MHVLSGVYAYDIFRLWTSCALCYVLYNIYIKYVHYSATQHCIIVQNRRVHDSALPLFYDVSTLTIFKIRDLVVPL